MDTKALWSVKEAASSLNVGVTTMRDLLTRGMVSSVKIGNKRLVPPEAIAAYVSALREAAEAERMGL